MLNIKARTSLLVFIILAVVLLFSNPAQSLIRSIRISPSTVVEDEITNTTDYNSTLVPYDRFGNELSLEDLQTDFPPLSTVIGGGGCNCPNGSGIFELTFEDVCIGRDYGFADPVFGPDRQAVACQVFADLSELLNPSGSIPDNHVRILVAPSEGLGVSVLDGALARATPVILSGFVNGISPGMVMKAIQSNADPYMSMSNYDPALTTNSAHGQIRVNFQDFDFFLNTDLTAPTPPTLQDLYTTVLHESLHLLGFYSLMDAEANNQSLIGLSNFSKYDTHIRTVGGVSNTSNGTPFYLNYPTTTPYVVDVATTSFVQSPLCSADAEYSGNSLPSQELYLPYPWNSSGLSHLNCDASNIGGLGCATGNGYVMNYCGPPGYTQRSPAQEEVSILCDLGYELSSHYGSDAYGGSTGGNVPHAEYTICKPGTCNAVGVNDFFAIAPYVAYSDGEVLEVPAEVFLANDVNTAGYVPNSFEMLATNISAGQIEDIGDGQGFTFTASGLVSGIYVVARYLPMCEDGTPGSWAYLFIAIITRNNCLSNTPCTLTSDCNLICDGSFEDTTPGNSSCHGDFYNSNSGVTPDVYGPDFALGDYSFEISNDRFCGLSYPGDILNPIPGELNYLGFVNSFVNHESWEFRLRDPLIVGELYRLSFWVNSGCDVNVHLGFSTTKACPQETGVDIAPAMIDGLAVNCGNYLYQLDIIEQEVLSTDIDNDGTPDWKQYEIEFIASDESRYLMLFMEREPFFGAGFQYSFFDDLVLTRVPNPSITISHQVPEVICPGETVDIPITVCSDIDPGTVSLGAFFDSFNLTYGNGGDFVAGSAILTDFVEDQGVFCQTTVLQLVVDENADTGPANLFEITIDPNGACLPTDGYEFSFDLMNCEPVSPFACECDDPNLTNINIDAGAGMSITETPLWDLATSTSLATETYDNTNGCIAVKGRLIIDEISPGQWADFGILGGEIRMQPGAEIIIEDNGPRLALKDVSQNGGIHGCFEMWQGITADLGAELYMENCTLSDAVHGVTMNDKSVIDLIDNDFDANHIGLFTEDGATKIIYSRGAVPLVSNEFTANTLLPPYEGENAQAGIFLNNTVMEIGQSYDLSNKNRFLGLNNGIIASESNIAIHSTEISGLPDADIDLSNLEATIGSGILLQKSSVIGWSNVISATGAKSVGILAHRSSLNALGNILTIPNAIELRDCNNEQFYAQRNIITVNAKGTGLLLYNSDAISSAIIDDNSFTSSTAEQVDFIRIDNPGIPVVEGVKQIRNNNTFTIPEDNQRAVFLINAGGWEVSRCDIDYVGAGGTTIQGTFAIVAYGCTDLYISENNINAINPGAFYHGLMFSNTTATEACCNVINNGHTNMFYFGHSEGTTTRHTILGDANVGLDSWEGTVIGVLNELTDRFEHPHTGNRWEGNYGLSGARNNSSDADIEQSVFLVEGAPFTSPLWPPNISTPNGTSSWFLSAPGSSAICETDVLCPAPGFTEEEEETDLGKYKDFSFVGLYSDMLNWERDQYRLGKLTGIADLHSRNSQLFSFVEGSRYLPIGQFFSLRDAMKSQYQYGQTYLARATEIYDLEADLIATYSRLASETNTQTIEQLIIEKDAILENLAISWGGFISEKNIAINTQKQLASDLLADNDVLPTSSIFTQNEQVVNAVYLSKIVSGEYDLSLEEEAQIRPIAEQCVLESGKVVYRARALYRLAENRWFQDECTSIQALQSSGRDGSVEISSLTSSSEKEKLNDSVRIFPNPAHQFLQVKLPNEFDGKDVVLRLMSVDGKEVQKWRSNGAISQELDISPLPAGIYWFNVRIDNYSFVNKRIVILP